MDYAIANGLSTVCEAGKMCVNPTIFAELCYKGDAIKLGILCFLAGIALMLLINKIEDYLNGSD